MSIFTSAVRGLKATVQGGYGGRYGFFGRSWMGGREGIDLKAEAGARVDNSIVYTAIQRTTLAFLEADIIVKRAGPKGKLIEVPGHPITELLKRPVPWYGGHDLRALWCMAEILAGNAYTLKHRSSNNKLIGLEYLPLSTCKPVSNPGSGNFIDYYEVLLSYGVDRMKPEDIYHQKWQTLNPWTPAVSIGPLEACLPQIAMDNRAARYEAAVLRNGGKAHLLTPRGQDRNGNPLVFGPEQRKQLNELMAEEATGDMAGTAMGVNFPMEVLEMGWKPSDLMLGPTHDLSEERIAASIGAPLSWLGMGSGLESDSNRATRESVIEMATDFYVLPHLQRMEMQLTEDLVPELGEPGDVVEFNRTQIAALRKRFFSQVEAGFKATGRAVVTVNEFREHIGLDAIEGGETLEAPSDPKQPQTPFEDPNADPEDEPNEDAA